MSPDEQPRTPAPGREVAAPASGREVAAFYDDLAATYDRIFPDWAASSRRQGAALHALLTRELGPGPHDLLDAAAGIGTQLLGLAGHGSRVVGTDVSGAALRRARAAGAGGRRVAVADMRALPFADGTFDAVVCADNALPHLLTAADVVTALREMRRVTRPGGLVAVSTRDYDALRAERPRVTPAQVSGDGDDTVVTVQVWAWHPDGERYDLDHLQLRPDPGTGSWRVAVRRTAYWAITRGQLTAFAEEAGLAAPRWLLPDGGFPQPLLVARVP